MMKYSSLGKNRFIILAFIFTLVLSLFVFFYGEDFQYKKFKAGQYFNKYFNSSSGDPNISGIQGFSIKEDIKVEEVDISFRMKIYEIDNFNNVFQTAPGNFGIRMELSQPNIFGLVIGYKNAEGVKGRF